MVENKRQIDKMTDVSLYSQYNKLADTVNSFYEI